MRLIGTRAMGIRTPIIQKGDNLIKIVTDAIVNLDKQGTKINDGDIISVTEAVVAIAQNNYATTDQIAQDVKGKFGTQDVGVVFPIMSRNRFSMLLKGIAKATDKVYVQFSYPNDEMGNNLINSKQLREKGINPYTDSFTEKEFRDLFGYNTVHMFTGVDYIEFYKSISDNIEIVFSNDPEYILNFTKNVLCADIHSRHETKAILEKANAKKIFTLDDILDSPVDGSGYNPEYGVMGTNKANEETVKLFPRDSKQFVNDLQNSIKNALGKTVECIIYGDGAFKDPKCGIWELADPVVSPGYTSGLEGMPNELKLKYLADGIFSDLTNEALSDAIIDAINNKKEDLIGNMSSEGTTPRQISDLIGSLSDLISGSGDKGTPVVLIQGYFDNYSDN